MPQTEPQAEPQTEKPKKVRKTYQGPGYVDVYANTAQGAYTPWDVQITFGRLDTLDNEPAIAELVTVVMSPQHAKALLRVLESAIRGFEGKHGEIKLSAAHAVTEDVKTVSVKKPGP